MNLNNKDKFFIQFLFVMLYIGITFITVFTDVQLKNRIISEIKASEKRIIKEIHETRQRQDVYWLEMKMKKLELQYQELKKLKDK